MLVYRLGILSIKQFKNFIHIYSVKKLAVVSIWVSSLIRPNPENLRKEYRRTR